MTFGKLGFSHAGTILVVAGLWALSGCGGGSSSGTDTAPSVAVPGAPTAVVATAGDGSANLTFTAPANSGGAAITGYRASCAAGSSTVTANGSASPINVTGLTNGTTYSCTVVAQNSAGSGPASAAVSVAPTGPAMVRYVYMTDSRSIGSGSTAQVLTSISLIDPAAPSKAYVVEPADASIGVIEAMYAGDFNAATGVVANTRQTNLLYVKGKAVYRLPLESSVGVPTPILVTTLPFQPCVYYGNYYGYDFAKPENSRFTITLAGSDGKCDPNTRNYFEFFPLRASPAGRSPAVAGPYIWSPADGSVAGQLQINSNGQLRYFAADQTTAVDVGTLPTNAAGRVPYNDWAVPGAVLFYPEAVLGSNDGAAYLFTTTGMPQLKKFDLANASLDAYIAGSDRSAFYLQGATLLPSPAFGRAAPDRVWRIPIDGSPATLIFTAHSVDVSLHATATDKNLIVNLNGVDPSSGRRGGSVLSISKSDGQSRLLWFDPTNAVTGSAVAASTVEVRFGTTTWLMRDNVVLGAPLAALSNVASAGTIATNSWSLYSIFGASETLLYATPAATNSPYYSASSSTLVAVSTSTGQQTVLGSLPDATIAGGTTLQADTYEGQVGTTSVLTIRFIDSTTGGGTPAGILTKGYVLDTAKANSLTEPKP